MSLPVHRGRFGEPEAHRLLWRAGFGPRPGQAAKLAELGLDGAVRSLTHPASRRLVGPRPRDGEGNPLAPATPGAATTCGGWTAWCAPRRRSSSA